MDSKTYDGCPIRLLYPSLQACKVSGFNIFAECVCVKSLPGKRASTLYPLYVDLLEAVWWLLIVKDAVEFVATDELCGDWGLAFGTRMKAAEVKMLKLIFVLFFTHSTLQFSILKKKKLYFCYKKSSYQEEVCLSAYFERMSALVFLGIYSICLVVIIAGESSVFHAHKAGRSDTVALICTLAGLWETINALLIVVYFLAQTFSAGLILYYRLRRLNQIFRKIVKNPENNGSTLEEVVVKHTEILDCFAGINRAWEYSLPLLYGMFIYIISFFTYAFLFTSMKGRKVLSVLCYVFFLVFLIFAYSASRLIEKLYGDFADAHVFSGIRASAPRKLKILNFTKRFGRRPIGISVGGFFYVKKHFLFRVTSAFYSILSGLLQIGFKRATGSCRPSTAANVTAYESWSTR